MSTFAPSPEVCDPLVGFHAASQGVAWRLHSNFEALSNWSVLEMGRPELICMIHAAGPSAIGRPELADRLTVLDARLLTRLAFLARRCLRNARQEEALNVPYDLVSVSDF